MVVDIRTRAEAEQATRSLNIPHVVAATGSIWACTPIKAFGVDQVSTEPVRPVKAGKYIILGDWNHVQMLPKAEIDWTFSPVRIAVVARPD